MQQSEQKWLPSYRAITLLSLLAAVIVTIAFVYFSVTFFLEERAISRPPHPVATNKDAFRVLITDDFSEPNRSPVRAGILSYLSEKMEKRVVPVQRMSLSDTDRILDSKRYDIALTPKPPDTSLAQKTNTDPLVVSAPKNSRSINLWVSARKNLDETTRQRIKKILLAMDGDNNGKQILSDLGIKGFVEIAPHQ